MYISCELCQRKQVRKNERSVHSSVLQNWYLIINSYNTVKNLKDGRPLVYTGLDLCRHCRSDSYHIIHREVTVSCHHCMSDSYHIIHRGVTVSCHQYCSDSYHISHREVTVLCHHCRSDSYHISHREVRVVTREIWGGWGCGVSCGGHHRPRGKATTGSALDGAVFDIAQILVYLVHNMSRSQLYLGFGHFGWLPSFFG